MFDGTFYVYTHETLSGELFYVGKGWRGRAGEESSRNIHWRRKVAKHGGYAVRFVFTGTEQECIAEEVRLIAKYRAEGVKLVNMTEGGEGASGITQAPETIAKRAAANRGKKRTPAQVARITAVHVGAKRSDATRQKISAAAQGRKMPEAVKRKISRALKGRLIR